MTPPIVTILRPLTVRLTHRVRQCGRDFRYESHLEFGATAVRVACLCPDGHGVAGLPWRGWISLDEAHMELQHPVATRPLAACA